MTLLWHRVTPQRGGIHGIASAFPGRVRFASGEGTEGACPLRGRFGHVGTGLTAAMPSCSAPGAMTRGNGHRLLATSSVAGAHSCGGGGPAVLVLASNDRRSECPGVHPREGVGDADRGNGVVQQARPYPAAHRTRPPPAASARPVAHSWWEVASEPSAASERYSSIPRRSIRRSRSSRLVNSSVILPLRLPTSMRTGASRRVESRLV